MYKININLAFVVKIFFIFLLSIAPLIDNNLIASGIANTSSPRLKTYPIFVCVANLLVIFFMFYKSSRINFYKSDIPWILLVFILLISNFFSIASYEDKISFMLVIITSVIAAIYLSSNKKDGFESFFYLILIFSSIAFSIFLVRLGIYGDIGTARGGLNIYTMSGVISWLILLSAFLYPGRAEKKFKLIIYLLNIMITIISIVSANRMGLVASMLLWIVLFVKYNKGFLISLIIACLYLAPILYSYISELYIFVRLGAFNADLDFFIGIFMGSRGDIWLESWNVFITTYPLFGTGLGGFHYLDIVGTNLDSAHNFFLNILVEHGIIGSVFILLLLMVVFKNSFKKAFYFISIFFFFLFISGWTILQPVGFISALNLIIIILYSRSALPSTGK
jgi:hypothetical protein